MGFPLQCLLLRLCGGQFQCIVGSILCVGHHIRGVVVLVWSVDLRSCMFRLLASSIGVFYLRFRGLYLDLRVFHFQ